MNISEQLHNKLASNDIAFLKKQNYCPFWCLVGKCHNLVNQNNQTCALGLHTTIISDKIKDHNYSQALKLTQYFEQLISNDELNILEKDKSMLLACIYEHFADLLMLNDKNYELSDYYFDKSNEIYPNYCPRILKQIKLIDKFIKNKIDKSQ